MYTLIIFLFFLWVPGDTRSDLDYCTEFCYFKLFCLNIKLNLNSFDCTMYHFAKSFLYLSAFVLILSSILKRPIILQLTIQVQTITPPIRFWNRVVCLFPWRKQIYVQTSDASTLAWFSSQKLVFAIQFSCPSPKWFSLWCLIYDWSLDAFMYFGNILNVLHLCLYTKTADSSNIFLPIHFFCSFIFTFLYNTFWDS